MALLTILLSLNFFSGDIIQQDSVKQDSIAQVFMEAVEVIGKESSVSIKDGEVYVDLQDYIKNPNESALDVLRRIPGIEINEQTRLITYQNLPIRFKLNGVNQANMYEMLKSLPANLLKFMVTRRGELTGDRVDPENPILDIVLTKKRLEGFMGQLDGRALGSEYDGYKFDGNGNITLMSKRFTITSNEVFSYSQDYKKREFDSISYPTSGSYYINDRSVDGKNKNFSNNINISYLSETSHQLSLNFHNSKKLDNPNINQLNYSKSGLDSRSHQLNNQSNDYYSGNIKFQSNPAKKSNTQLSYGIIYYDQNVKNIYNNKYSDTTFHIIQQQLFSGTQHHANWITTYRGLKDKLIINFGATANISETKYNLENHDRIQVQTKYNEYSIIPQLNLTIILGKRNIITAALKEEYSFYKLCEYSGEQIKNDSWIFLPTVTWRYMPSSNYTSTLYLLTHTQRPSFLMLSPRKDYVSDRYFISGNPNLKPKDVYQLSWQQIWKQNIVLSVSLVKEKNTIVEMLVSDNDIVTQTHMNAIDIKGVKYNLKVPISFCEKKLKATFTADLDHYKISNLRNDFTPYRRTCLQGSGQIDISYQPNSRWYFMGAYHRKLYTRSYYSDMPSYEYSYYYAQYICGKKYNTTFSLMVTDPFNSSMANDIRYSHSAISVNRREPMYRSVQVGISWRFKGGKDFNRKINNTDANNEINRFK
ncbi:MAG: outer membrane beta-barrel protein [Marinifilaceae bacterium]